MRQSKNEYLGIANVTEAIQKLAELQVIWLDSIMDIVTGDTHFYRQDMFIATHSIKTHKLIISTEIQVNE